MTNLALNGPNVCRPLKYALNTIRNYNLGLPRDSI